MKQSFFNFLEVQVLRQELHEHLERIVFCQQYEDYITEMCIPEIHNGKSIFAKLHFMALSSFMLHRLGIDYLRMHRLIRLYDINGLVYAYMDSLYRECYF